MAKRKQGKHGGSPAIVVTPELRAQVLAMAGFGMRQEDIAAVLGFSLKTLKRRFKTELSQGVVKANVKVAESLYKQATESQNTTAMIFWLKCRARWREVTVHEHSGLDGAPISAIVENKIDLTGVTTEDLLKLLDKTT